MFGNIIMREGRARAGAVITGSVLEAIEKASGGKKLSMQDIQRGAQLAMKDHPAYEKYGDGSPKGYVRDIAIGDQSMDNVHAIIDTPNGFVRHPIEVDEAGKIKLKGDPMPTHTMYKSKFPPKKRTPEEEAIEKSKPKFNGILGRHTRLAKSATDLKDDPDAFEKAKKKDKPKEGTTAEEAAESAATEGVEDEEMKKGQGGHLVTDDKGNKHLPTETNGKADHRLMGAAWASLHGGYRGNKYEGPDKQKAITKLEAKYKAEGLETPKA